MAGAVVSTSEDSADDDSGDAPPVLGEVVVPVVPGEPVLGDVWEPVDGVVWPESGAGVVVVGEGLVPVGETVVSVGDPGVVDGASLWGGPGGGEVVLGPQVPVRVDVLGHGEAGKLGGLGVGFVVQAQPDGPVVSGVPSVGEDGEAGWFVGGEVMDPVLGGVGESARAVSPLDESERVVGVPAEVGAEAAQRVPGHEEAGAEVGPEQGDAGPGVLGSGDLPMGESVGVVGEGEGGSQASAVGGGAVGVAVVVDVSGFGPALGGNGLLRLGVARVVECVAGQVPGGPVESDDAGGGGCGLVPVASVVDPGAETVSAVVPVGALGADGGTFVVVSGSGGAGGTYSATPLTVAGTWQVGLGSGSFEYSYPLPSGPVVTGPSPELSLGYSSGAVDGLTSGDHAQVPGVGVGWSLSEAYIEHQFGPCAVPGHPWDGDDLCHKGEFYRIVLNGHASDLVKDADATAGAPSGVSVFRLRSDPNWRVEQRVGSFANGDHEKHFWRVMTPDGTRYEFGRGYVDRPGGREFTDSVWTVPVFARYVGRPCYATPYWDAWCDQAWRWNLDRVTDTSNNTISYFYEKEINHYAMLQGYAIKPYTRGGFLDRVEYSTRMSSNVDQVPRARTKLVWENRCTARVNGSLNPSGTCPAVSLANAASYPDVPVDLMCTEVSCDDWGPSFFSTKLLREVSGERFLDGSWAKVDSVRMGYTFPTHTDGTSPDLTLHRLRSIGHADNGTYSLPHVDFSYTQLPNRVDANPGAGVPALYKHRLTGINDELAAHTQITYGHPSSARDCSPLPSQWDTNTQDCFPRFWKPDGAPAGFGVFYKYVTLQVKVVNTLPGKQSGMVTSSADRLTRYTYVGEPAWAHDDIDDILVWGDAQSYSDWRGYRDVEVREYTDPGWRGGSSPVALNSTHYRFFRGMHGTKLIGGGTRSETVPRFSGSTMATDWAYLAGQVRDTRSMSLHANGTDNVELTGSANAFTTARVIKADPSGPGNPLRDAVLVVPANRVDRARDVAPDDTVSTQTTTTSFGYDAHGRLVTQSRGGTVAPVCVRINYAGDSAAITANKLDFPAVVATWDKACSVPEAQAGLLERSTTHYDGNNTTVLGGPVTRGLPTRVRTSLTPTTDVSSYATYDSYGRELSATDGNGGITTTARSAITADTQTVSVTNPAGHTQVSTLHARRLVPVTVSDLNGHATTLTYDRVGRLTSVVKPGDTTASPTMKFAYTLTSTKDAIPRITTSTRAPGAAGGYLHSTDFFDSFAQLRQTHTLAANGSGNARLVAYRYDERGYQSTATLPMTWEGAPGSGLIAVPMSQITETATNYDWLGRITRQRHIHHHTTMWTTTHTHHGLHRTVTTPPAGAVITEERRDLLGRVTQRIEGSGSTTATTKFAYDNVDRLTKVTDAGNQIATYTYDLAGRRVSTLDPNTGASSSSFDANGNTTSLSRASGQVVSTTYDALNRPLVISGKPNAPATPVPLATYTYDTATNGIGLAATMTVHAPAGDYTVSTGGYTNRGDPTSTTHSFPGVGSAGPTSYTTTHTYDAAQRPLSTGLPAAGALSAETLSYGYTNTGRAHSMTSPSSTYVRATTYHSVGATFKRHLGQAGAPGSGTSLDIENRYTVATWRPASTRVYQSVDGAPRQARLWDTYTWDHAGNLAALTDTLPADPVTTCHTYDQLGRLTHSWTTQATTCTDTDTSAEGPGGYNTRWAYNAAGNITSVTRHGQPATAYSYGDPAHPHALTQAGNTTYTHTPDGNTATETTPTSTTDYTWDLLGKLSTVTTTHTGGTGGRAHTTQFVHAPDGTRLARTTPEGTTTHYTTNQEIDHDSTGTITDTRRYYTHDGHTIAIRTPSTLIWQTTDWQGSTTLQTPDTDTTPPTRLHTDPYGQPQGATTPATDRHWLGKTTDPTTAGLVHLGHRYYNPTLGRFLTPDPLLVLTTTQSTNPYTYANNNPNTYTDPNGLCSVKTGVYIEGTQCQTGPSTPPKPQPKPGAGPSAGAPWAGSGSQASLSPVLTTPVAPSASNTPETPWARTDTGRLVVGGAGVLMVGGSLMACGFTFGIGCAVAAGIVAGGGGYITLSAIIDEPTTDAGMAKAMLIGGATGILGSGVGLLTGRIATNAVPPRFITTGAGTTIDRLAVNTSISAQRQGRHVLGARQYGGGSYFNSADDAQGVLDAFHSGGAQVLGTKGNDIVVRVPGITGFNHNPGAGFPNQATNVFFIKGSSSPSVVPYNPAWKP